jgi:hypothetical protein
MQLLRVPTANGIDDIKLLGETETERLFIKQLAEAGTLSCMSRQVANAVVFRPISVTPEISTYTSTKNSLVKFNFTVVQNTEYTVDLYLKRNRFPLNLTAFTQIKLAVKNSKHSPAIFEISLGNGLIVAGDNSTILRINFSRTQTARLCENNYYYDILMSNGSSNIYYVEGVITTKQTGTR